MSSRVSAARCLFCGSVAVSGRIMGITDEALAILTPFVSPSGIREQLESNPICDRCSAMPTKERQRSALAALKREVDTMYRAVGANRRQRARAWKEARKVALDSWKKGKR